MDRRNFLKSLMGGAACIVMPAASFSALQEQAIVKGELLNHGDFLRIEYDWLGTGRGRITRERRLSSPLTPINLIIDSRDKINRFMNVGEIHALIPSFSLNNKISIITDKGIKNTRIIDHLKYNYIPGQSLVFIVDLSRFI